MNSELGFDLKDWEAAEAIEMGDFESVKLGGHEVVILGAKINEGEEGKKSLKVIVDIAGKDEQAGYFKKQFDENTKKDKKWSNGATRYLSLKKENLGYTKGFITALEKSNPKFKFDTSKNWEQLKGLKCAGVFGLEEYEDLEGDIRVATKLVQFRSLDKLDEIKIPRVKLIDGSYVDYEEYKSGKKGSSKADDAIEISEEMLPF